jgi:hypothetical protein
VGAKGGEEGFSNEFALRSTAGSQLFVDFPDGWWCDENNLSSTSSDDVGRHVDSLLALHGENASG